MYVFFVKQKRAYEMRISDRSSDVCSSDLRVLHRLLSARFQAFQFFLGGLLDFLDAPGNVSLCRDIHLAHVQYSFLAEVLRDDLGGDLDRISRNALQFRSEERRVGKECVSTCSSRWSPYHYKKNTYKTERSPT